MGQLKSPDNALLSNFASLMLKQAKLYYTK